MTYATKRAFAVLGLIASSAVLAEGNRIESVYFSFGSSSTTYSHLVFFLDTYTGLIRTCSVSKSEARADCKNATGDYPTTPDSITQRYTFGQAVRQSISILRIANDGNIVRCNGRGDCDALRIVELGPSDPWKPPRDD